MLNLTYIYVIQSIEILHQSLNYHMQLLNIFLEITQIIF